MYNESTKVLYKKINNHFQYENKANENEVFSYGEY